MDRFTAWLFIASLTSYHRPWFAAEVARIMFDDDRIAAPRASA